MKIIQKITVVFALLLISHAAMAYKYVAPRGGQGQEANNEVLSTRAAACSPATGLVNLEYNNVRALIETGGSLWQDRAQSRASYFVPASSNLSVLYAGALWMGGRSPDQQLKLAAVRYRGDGDDFWPGPLTQQTAEIDETVCNEYDRFFQSFRQDALQHRKYHDALTNGDDIAELFPEGYVVPAYFDPDEYPAMGDVGQSEYLAPFYDYDGDGIYDPEFGDYPGYDVQGEIDCRALSREDQVPLFGDITYYWIFNDKGNVHSETNGQPIGMEIRAQAFAFATNDEINNMTFYNYVLINQGTQTLTNTYFGQYADPDVGTAVDDYVGCDVRRGLGYCYNGDDNDEPSSSSDGYGTNPPAVGIDFFEGPYQDADDIDNPLTDIFADAVDSLGIPYSGLGIGYGDGITDNERFGMRKFIYYNNGSCPDRCDPQIAVEHYNYMTGFWRDGTALTYSGTGYQDSEVLADYMFPYDSDPILWGTNGVEVEPWYEEGEGNAPNDRRFIESAGPFTLEPGQWNNITVGAVYARATTGTAFSSVELLLSADDKAQALFDNCFEIVEGPTAPDLTIQEMENKLIFTLTNDALTTNNFQETAYDEDRIGFDPVIPADPSLSLAEDSIRRSYRFQGYMVYQLANEDVSPAELDDEDKARLVFQCDIADGISQIINFERDPDVPFAVPTSKVNGADAGISHSFELTSDAFAQGDDELVNHKTYYYMPIAYGYNNYEEYNPNTGEGQAFQFLASRKSSTGALKIHPAIPHKVNPEAGGTALMSDYGDGVEITRIEGKGNNTQFMNITRASEEKILDDNFINELDYTANGGPVDIKVIDPTRVQDADFELKLAVNDEDFDDEDARWRLINLDNNDTIFSTRAFSYRDEFILLDYGISITFSQYNFVDPEGNPEVEERYTDFVGADLQFADPDKLWLFGIPDAEGNFELNWIRSGNVAAGDEASDFEKIYDDAHKAEGVENVFYDISSNYESVLGGTWSPFVLTSISQSYMQGAQEVVTPTAAPRSFTYDAWGFDWSFSGNNPVSNVIGLNNVDIVFTSDKSKWTRCGVLEMQAIPELTNTGNTEKMTLRDAPSVDKNGRSAGDNGYNDAEGTLNGEQPTGMGWFPGYAIDVGTGERLNMAFGEDSWLTGDNGNDMIWNPSSTLYEFGNPHFGGQHWIYVFKNMEYELGDDDWMPGYDEGRYMHDIITDWVDNGGAAVGPKRVFASCTWVGSAMSNPDVPMLSVEDGLIPTTTRVQLRVAKPYAKYSPTQADAEAGGGQNHWNPSYRFSTGSVAASYNNADVLEDALDDINVVPNPYYAYSEYENNKLDNRIKITNLPEECTVSIYNVTGTLVRQFKKADPLTSIDWDLKNHRNIPIAGGVYIIHVDVPGIGEKVIKWFGVIRPVDLDNF